MASQLNPDLGREWASELFALSLQVKGNRLQVQSTALNILIRLDPDRALDLLHQLGPDDPEGKSAAVRCMAPANSVSAQSIWYFGAPLVHIGMESDPDFTIPFVEGLPASRVKAEVLLDAAHALGTRGSPHIGAPPQQTAEKPNP
jgi:hypothetical protein